MYCKHCGKEIADDSKFCRYCGGKLDVTENINPSIRNENKTEKDEIKKPAISIEVTHKSKDNSSVVANEIVGNLKMVGIAMAMFAIYMIGFVLVHQKDTTKYDYATKTSYFGESCYDPASTTGNWRLHWEQHYYELLYFELYNQIPFGTEQMSSEQCLKEAEKLEKEWTKKREYIEKTRKNRPKMEGVATQLDIDAYMMESRNLSTIKQEAKEKTERDIQDWNDKINNHRKWAYIDDLKKHALYAILISLLVTIGGRYIIKLRKWTNQNKTVQEDW